jgi:SsrA-binding protein
MITPLHMNKTLIQNRKARFNYEIQATLEAGIKLLGFEVKALKEGKGSLEGSYIVPRHGELYLVKMTISPYQVGNTPVTYVPDCDRKILVSKKEIKELESLVGTKNSGLTLIPLSIYLKNNKIKVEVATVRGKKKFDKRESIKKREAKRDQARDLL